MRRFIQVLHFGWGHTVLIAKEQDRGLGYTICIFFDIICCYLKYHLYSNEYMKERFYLLKGADKKKIGEKYRLERNRLDKWWSDFYKNRSFLNKYTVKRYEESPYKMEVRNQAYRRRYNMGKNCHVEYNVEITRQHALDGTIRMGDDVLLCRNVFIDYSGDVFIDSGVKISANVKIETHGHASYTNSIAKGAYKTPLIIEKNVQIGIGTIIMEGCNRIGKEARIGAGAVIRSNVPPYAIVLGNPAKIVGFTIAPQDLEVYECEKYSVEERTSKEKYMQIYEKYVSMRTKEIVNCLKL